MFTLNDILEGNPGNVSLSGVQEIDPTEVIFSSAQHDSRRVQPGDLFVAIKGEQVDGWDFVDQAGRAGARGVLGTRSDPALPSEFLQLVVPDCTLALQGAARVRAKRQPDTIRIGITGSSGKTSTKEAIAALLSPIVPVLKTYSSYNNELGYPITLLDLKPEHRYAVLEMGAERVGELKGICETIAAPHWSVITSVGAAHLKHFGSLENVAIAKSELVQCLSPDGFAFLNYDDLTVRAMAEKTKAQIVFYGRGDGALVHGSDPDGDPLFGYSFTLSIGNQQRRIQLQIPGEHGITIALAAAAVAYHAGVSLDDIQSALPTIKTVTRRGEIRSGPNGSRMIDDTYNAIRQSIVAIVHAMQSSPLAPGGKRWVVLSDLLEQGEYARYEHETTGASLVGAIDYLVAIGEYARFFADGALQAGMPQDHIFYFPARIEEQDELEKAKQAAAALLQARVNSSDVILVKGSNGTRMNTLFNMF